MSKIRLKNYEDSKSLDDGVYESRLSKLQEKLVMLQAAYIFQGLRGIVAVEGWDAAGKGGLIRRMVEPLDPRFTDVWSIYAPTDVERREHYLERFWRKLPDKRELTIYDRTWYGRVLVERVDGFCTEAEWQRAYDEINQFEAMQAADGVRIVKLFLHTTQKEQDKRLKERIETPWKRWKTGLDDYHNRSKREAYMTAYHDMFDKTDTKIAPWTVIAGSDKKAARIAGLEAMIDGLGAGVKLEYPDTDPAILKVAKKAGVI
jgi:polyphosphate kinase 2 (PPK2 family)